MSCIKALRSVWSRYMPHSLFKGSLSPHLQVINTHWRYKRSEQQRKVQFRTLISESAPVLISLFIHLFIIHLKGFNFTSSIPGDISISTSSCRMTFPSQNSLKMSVSVQMNWTGDPKMSSISHRVFISAATGATRFLYIYMIYNMI